MIMTGIGSFLAGLTGLAHLFGGFWLQGQWVSFSVQSSEMATILVAMLELAAAAFLILVRKQVRIAWGVALMAGAILFIALSAYALY